MSRKRRRDQTSDNTLLALKYPDFHTWRDLDAAMANGGYWPSGQPIRISDPEMKPRMDDLMAEICESKESAKAFLKDSGII